MSEIVVQPVHPAITKNILPIKKSGFVPGSRKTIAIPLDTQGVETGNRTYKADFGGVNHNPDNANQVIHPHTAYFRIRATLATALNAPIPIAGGYRLLEDFDSKFFDSMTLMIDGKKIDCHNDFPMPQHVQDRFYTEHNQDRAFFTNPTERSQGQQAMRRLNPDDLSGGIKGATTLDGDYAVADIEELKEFYIYIPLSVLSAFGKERGRTVLSMANRFSIIAKSSTRMTRWFKIPPLVGAPILNIIQAHLVMDVEKLDTITADAIMALQTSASGQRLAVDQMHSFQILPNLLVGTSDYEQSSMITFPQVPDVIFLMPFSTEVLQSTVSLPDPTFKHWPFELESIRAIDQTNCTFFELDNMTSINGQAQAVKLMQDYFTKEDGSSVLTAKSGALLEYLFTIPIVMKPVDDKHVTESGPFSFRLSIHYKSPLTNGVSWFAVGKTGRILKLSAFPGQTGFV